MYQFLKSYVNTHDPASDCGIRTIAEGVVGVGRQVGIEPFASPVYRERVEGLDIEFERRDAERFELGSSEVIGQSHLTHLDERSILVVHGRGIGIGSLTGGTRSVVFRILVDILDPVVNLPAHRSSIEGESALWNGESITSDHEK